MSNPTSADIISKLPKLDQKELEKVKQTLEFLTSDNIVPQTNEKNDDDWLYDAMLKALEANGVKRTLPYNSFKNNGSYKKWKTGVQEVLYFINTTFPNNLRRVEKLAIVRILTISLIRDMRRREIPITLNTVAQNIGRLPEVFDIAFPGYIDSGLAYLIPQQLKNNSVTV